MHIAAGTLGGLEPLVLYFLPTISTTTDSLAPEFAEPNTNSFSRPGSFCQTTGMPSSTLLIAVRSGKATAVLGHPDLSQTIKQLVVSFV